MLCPLYDKQEKVGAARSDPPTEAGRGDSTTDILDLL